MSRKREISVITIILFSFFILSSSYSPLYSQTEKKDNELSELLKSAEEHYQNGNFKKAIEIYENIIQLLYEKKELAETKQKLYKTMLSLSLTYFTIQENEKAESQLEKLIRINPNQELDPEFYSPKFIGMFKSLQKKLIGSLQITSAPENADIFFNNKNMGKTPLILKKVIKGDCELRAELNGYIPDKRNIIIVQGTENKIDIILKRSEKAPVIEKPVSKPKKKKKKKSSGLLIIGGIAVVALVLLLSKKEKKKEPEPQLVSRVFGGEPFEIKPNRQSAGSIHVEGIPRRIERIEYLVRVEFPTMQQLILSILGTDSETSHAIWNRQPSQEEVTEIPGSTQVFNSLDPNGNWVLYIRNIGGEEGHVVEWFLRIFYFQ